MNNLCGFIAIYAVFVLNLCGEKMTNIMGYFYLNLDWSRMSMKKIDKKITWGRGYFSCLISTVFVTVSSRMNCNNNPLNIDTRYIMAILTVVYYDELNVMVNWMSWWGFAGKPIEYITVNNRYIMTILMNILCQFYVIFYDLVSGSPAW